MSTSYSLHCPSAWTYFLGFHEHVHNIENFQSVVSQSMGCMLSPCIMYHYRRWRTILPKILLDPRR